MVHWAYRDPAAIPVGLHRVVWSLHHFYSRVSFPVIAVSRVLAGQTAGFIHAASTLQWGLMTTTFSLSHAAYLLVLAARNGSRLEPLWSSPEAALAAGLGLVLFLMLLTELNDVAQYVWGKSFGGPRSFRGSAPTKLGPASSAARARPSPWRASSVRS